MESPRCIGKDERGSIKVRRRFRVDGEILKYALNLNYVIRLRRLFSVTGAFVLIFVKMKILEIYTQYRIMPSLQLHMLRVAGVASMICDNLVEFHEEKEVASACLLHDMGNIIKFKLGFIPEAVLPEGLDYWEKVKKDFIERYGSEEHFATIKIAQEIGVGDKAEALMNAMGFSKSVENEKHRDLAKKVCAYSDLRVAPFGIDTLMGRLQDLRARRLANKGFDRSDEEFGLLAESMRKIENQIFSVCGIKPEEITDATVGPSLEALRQFEL